MEPTLQYRERDLRSGEHASDFEEALSFGYRTHLVYARF